MTKIDVVLDADLPSPLVPPEVDLRDFGFMPLDVRTLLTSSLWIKAKKDPRVAHAAVSLWCECWHQVPAGSLPDDDEVLAELARCDDREWKRIRARALLHFVKCSDGRLYHRHVATKALESWQAKQAQRARTRKATEAKEKARREAEEARRASRDDQRDVHRDDHRDVDRDVHQGTGTVKGQGDSLTEPKGSGAPAPPPTDRDMVFANGVTLLTSSGVSDKNARSFLAAQCKSHGEAAVLAALQRCASERPIQPVPWLQAALKATPARTAAAQGPKSFRERDLEVRSAEAAAWMGSFAPDSTPPSQGDVLDMPGGQDAPRLAHG